MPRRKEPEAKTARWEIGDVIKWADRQGFHSIAAALRRPPNLLDNEVK